MKKLNVRGRAMRVRVGTRYTLVGPSGLTTMGRLFGTIENGSGRYIVLRVDHRATPR